MLGRECLEMINDQIVVLVCRREDAIVSVFFYVCVFIMCMFSRLKGNYCVIYCCIFE